MGRSASIAIPGQVPAALFFRSSCQRERKSPKSQQKFSLFALPYSEICRKTDTISLPGVYGRFVDLNVFPRRTVPAEIFPHSISHQLGPRGLVLEGSQRAIDLGEQVSGIVA